MESTYDDSIDLMNFIHGNNTLKTISFMDDNHRIYQSTLMKIIKNNLIIIVSVIDRNNKNDKIYDLTYIKFQKETSELLTYNIIGMINNYNELLIVVDNNIQTNIFNVLYDKLTVNFSNIYYTNKLEHDYILEYVRDELANTIPMIYIKSFENMYTLDNNENENNVISRIRNYTNNNSNGVNLIVSKLLMYNKINEYVTYMSKCNNITKNQTKYLHEFDSFDDTVCNYKSLNNFIIGDDCDNFSLTNDDIINIFNIGFSNKLKICKYISNKHIQSNSLINLIKLDADNCSDVDVYYKTANVETYFANVILNNMATLSKQIYNTSAKWTKTLIGDAFIENYITFNITKIVKIIFNLIIRYRHKYIDNVTIKLSQLSDNNNKTISKINFDEIITWMMHPNFIMYLNSCKTLEIIYNKRVLYHIELN